MCMCIKATVPIIEIVTAGAMMKRMRTEEQLGPQVVV